MANKTTGTPPEGGSSSGLAAAIITGLFVGVVAGLLFGYLMFDMDPAWIIAFAVAGPALGVVYHYTAGAGRRGGPNR